jgi:hypothetical protein
MPPRSLVMAAAMDEQIQVQLPLHGAYSNSISGITPHSESHACYPPACSLGNMPTPGRGTRPGVIELLHLDIGRPDQLAPLIGFVSDELAELRWRAR